MKHRSENRVGELQDFEVAGRLTIDLAALKANWIDIAHRAKPAETSAVVKADAYGLGIDRVVPALAEAGCETFFVAILSEARQVRAIVPDAAVYVLEGLADGAEGVFRDHSIRPVLGSPREIRRWARFCRETDCRLPAAVHVDTGMNRLGLSPFEIDETAETPAVFNDFNLALVMSHLACADTPDHPLNRRQADLFDALRRRLPVAPASIANSGGILMGPRYHYDLVRPGIAIYGGNPIPALSNSMRQVVTVEARIIRIRVAHAGEPIGYGATQRLAQDGRLAILSAGYADGYFRTAGGSDDRPGSAVAINGRLAPVIGRVSMDMIAVDISGFDENEVKTGDYAELLGHRITVDELAGSAATISYEVLTNLGRRFRRVLKEG